MEPVTTTTVTASQEGSLKPFTGTSPSNNKTTNLKPRTAVMEAVEDILYGSIAGIVGKYIEYPFDTVKVRLQSQPDHLPLRYKGPWDCFGQSIRSDGFLGLYRGISAPLFGAALENSSLFFWERLGRAAIYASGYTPREQPLPLSALWLTGAFSGAMTSFVLTPVELVKCKIQVPETGEAGGVEGASGKPKPAALRPLPVIRDIWRHQGLRGFWHGQLGTLIRESGGCAAWFGSKETVTKLFREWNGRRSGGESGTMATKEAKIRHHDSSPDDDALPLWQQAVAGASAGMMYNFLFFPADTVKSRMQTTPIGEGAATEYRSFSAETAALWKQAGLKGFYRGCGITVMRSVPSSAFIFIVYDGLKKHFPLQ